MTKYVFSYHGDSEMPTDQAVVDEIMAAWGAWFGSLGDALVDGGNPFGASKSVASDGSVTDGNAARLSGYSIVNADSIDAAVTMAQGCPILGGDGSSITVSEAIEM
jgi:hypothetical protein